MEVFRLIREQKRGNNKTHSAVENSLKRELSHAGKFIQNNRKVVHLNNSKRDQPEGGSSIRLSGVISPVFLFRRIKNNCIFSSGSIWQWLAQVRVIALVIRRI